MSFSTAVRYSADLIGLIFSGKVFNDSLDMKRIMKKTSQGAAISRRRYVGQHHRADPKRGEKTGYPPGFAPPKLVQKNPSNGEIFSIAISEAWARSRPVIASAVGEIPYRVGHMENGLLVPPRNHEALAKAIITLLEDEQLAKKLGARGKQGVYTWEEVAKEVEELIARL